MSTQAYAQLKPHLLPGESLLWCGRPGKRRTEALLRTVLALFVSFVWLIFLRVALGSGEGGPWVGLFVLTVLTYLAWRAVLDVWFGVPRTAYGVTTRRVVIVEPGLRSVVKSIDYGFLREVQLSGGPAFGTIRCARSSMLWKNQARPGRVAHPALFRRIAEAGAVRDLILTQQAQSVYGDSTRARLVNDERGTSPIRNG